MSDKLLPCPHCGGQAMTKILSGSLLLRYVQCLQCRSLTEAERDAERAIANWNRRFVPPREPEARATQAAEPSSGVDLQDYARVEVLNGPSIRGFNDFVCQWPDLGVFLEETAELDDEPLEVRITNTRLTEQTFDELCERGQEGYR